MIAIIIKILNIDLMTGKSKENVMEISHLIARIMGIMMIVLYGGVLLNQKFYQGLWHDIAKHPISLLLSGFISLLVGLLIIQVHSVWTTDWRVLITLLGWLLILSGIARILVPHSVLRLSRKVFELGPNFINGTSGVMLLLGLYLTYKGFFS